MAARPPLSTHCETIAVAVYCAAMNGLAFTKMHGLGNDFVILDGRTAPLDLAPESVRRVADRRRGIGCDQLIVLEPSARADLFMRIFNPDGGEAEACGNATRCVARLLAEEGARQSVRIETVAGVLDAAIDGEGGYAIDMGTPRFGWREIPLAEPRDTLHLGIEAGPLVDPVAVNIGNPHAVFFVDAADALPLGDLGPELEHHPLFPERANIEAAEIRDRTTIRLRVWERGAGLTLACGSGACAALVAAVRRGLTEREADVILDGGTLRIAWSETGPVVMSGPASRSFSGTLSPELLGASP